MKRKRCCTSTSGRRRCRCLARRDEMARRAAERELGALAARGVRVLGQTDGPQLVRKSIT